MGRPAGSTNKPRTALLRALQEKFPGYHPVTEMARIAAEARESGDTQLELQANKEVAQYVTPKLKAVEHSGEVTANIYRPIRKRFDGEEDKPDADT